MPRQTEAKRLQTVASDIWASTVANDTDDVAAANFAQPVQANGWTSDHAGGTTDLMRTVWNRLFYWLSSGVVEVNTIGIPEYVNSVDYLPGALVNSAGTIYRARVANGPGSTVRPTSHSGTWEIFEDAVTGTVETDSLAQLAINRIRPWAIDGERNLPNDEALVASTRLTRNVGYPSSYSDAAGPTPRRTILNQLFCEITSLQHEVLSRGVLEFDSEIPYQQYAIVQFNRKLYFRNSAGSGAFDASEWTAISGVIDPPDAPAITGQIVRGIQYRVSWSAPNDGGATITGYRIQQATNAAFTRDVNTHDLSASTLQFQTGNLTPGRTYYWRVNAVNSEGRGEWSNTLSQAIVAVAPIVAPTSLTLTRSGASIRVRFNPVRASDNGGSSITGYRIYYKSGNQDYDNSRRTFTQNTDSLITLTTGVEYDIVVTAVNAVGESPRSNEASLSPADVPSKTNQPTLRRTGRDIEVMWTAPNDNGSALTLFRLERAIEDDDGDPDFANPQEIITAAANATSHTFEGLAYGETYYFRIRAHNGIGSGQYSDTASTTIPAVEPSAPDAPDLTTTGTQIVSTWTEPAENGAPITGYSLQLSAQSDFSSGVTTASSNNLTHTFTNLTRGTTYYVRVAAINSAGTGAWSDASSIQVGALVPAQITTFSASAPAQTAELSWTAPAARGSAITHYDVQRALNAAFSSGLVSSTISAGTTTATFVDQPRGRTIYFRVRAANGEGEGAWSATRTVMIAALAPAKVGGLSLTADGTSLEAEWNEPNANGSAIIRYEVQLATNTGFTAGVQNASVSSRSHTFTNLTRGTTYYVRVRAVNDIGNGNYSDTSNAEIGAVRPSVITTLGVAVAGTALTGTWTAPSDNGSAITGYALELATNSGFTRGRQTASTNASTLTYQWSGLTRGVTYYVRVRATNGAGTADWSDAESGSIAALAPSQVVGLDMTTTGTRIDYAWSEPANNGSAIIRYEVQLATNTGFTAGLQTRNITSGRTARFTNLTRGTTYYGRVRAVNDIGNGNWSDRDSAAIAALRPDKTGGLTLSATGTQIASSWTAPNANGSAITGYSIDLSTSSDFSSGVTTATSSSTSHTFTGLDKGETYYVRVRAVNGIGNGNYSDTSSVTVPTTAPERPNNFSAMSPNGQGSAELSWSIPNSGGLPITGFIVQWKSGAQAFSSARQNTINSASATSTTIYLLLAETSYDFRVAAVNSKGTGTWSNIDSVTPPVDGEWSLSLADWNDAARGNNYSYFNISNPSRYNNVVYDSDFDTGNPPGIVIGPFAASRSNGVFTEITISALKAQGNSGPPVVGTSGIAYRNGLRSMQIKWTIVE